MTINCVHWYQGHCALYNAKVSTEFCGQCKLRIKRNGTGRTVELPQFDLISKRVAATRQVCDTCSENFGYSADKNIVFEEYSLCRVCNCPSKRRSMLLICPKGKF